MSRAKRSKARFTPTDPLAMYKGLFDNMTNGVAIFSAADDGRDFVFADFNAAAERIEQVRRADIVGRRITEIFPGVEEFGLLDVLRRVWRTGKAEHHPLAFYKDGRISGWRDNHVFKLPCGEVVAVYDDLTAEKEAEKQFKELARNIHDILWVASPDWQQIFYVSPGYDAIWGRPGEELHEDGQAWKDSIHPDDMPALAAAMEEKAGGNLANPTFPDFRVVRPDGDVRWVSLRAWPVTDDKGEVVRVSGLATDVTERKRTEEARARSRAVLEARVEERTADLRKSEERFRSFVDHMPSFIALKDPKGRLQFINRKHTELFGLEPKDIVGKTIFDVVPEEQARAAADQDRQVIETRSMINEERRVSTAQGPRDFLITKFPVLDDAGDVTAIGTIGTDVTEQRQAARALRESEALLRESQRVAGIGNWNWDIVEITLAWSDEIYRIFGVSPEDFEMTYEAFLERVHPDDRALITDSVDAALAGTKPYNIDHRIVLPDGTEKIVHEQAVVSFDDEGRPVRMFGTVHDVTERKQAEQQLIQSAKLATLGQMASGITHELNQPLNIIRMAAESSWSRLENGEVDVAALAEKLEQIEGQVTRMAEIIDHVRVFVREDRRGNQLFPPLGCIENLLVLFAQPLAAAGIGLSMDLPAECGLIRGSLVQFEQVILNLLTNARDAVAEWGKMMAFAGTPFEGRIRLSLADDVDAGTITVSITDNGGGIVDDVRQHIFDPFYTTKDEGTGTGLGLSISYKILESMGGRFEVQDVDGGTRFEIVLPRVDAAEAETEAAASTPKVDGLRSPMASAGPST